MRPKTKDVTRMVTSKLTPGPGTYDFKPSLSGTGKYFQSKFRSASVCVIQTPRENGKEGGKKAVPGPGQYAPRMEMSKTGDYFFSKFKGTGCRTQYHADR